MILILRREDPRDRRRRARELREFPDLTVDRLRRVVAALRYLERGQFWILDPCRGEHRAQPQARDPQRRQRRERLVEPVLRKLRRRRQTHSRAHSGQLCA